MIRLSEPELRNGGQLEDWCLSFFLPSTNRMLLGAGLLAEQIGRHLARSFREVMSANVTTQFLETDVTSSAMKKIPKSIGVFLDITFAEMPGQELSVELSTDDIEKLMRDLKENGRRHSMFWQENKRGTVPEEHIRGDMEAMRRKVSNAIIEYIEKISSDEEAMKYLFPPNISNQRMADEMTYIYIKDKIFHLIPGNDGGSEFQTPMITKGKG